MVEGVVQVTGGESGAPHAHTVPPVRPRGPHAPAQPQSADISAHLRSPEATVADKRACLELIEQLPALDTEEHNLLMRHVGAVHDKRAAALARAASGARSSHTGLGGMAFLVCEVAASVFVLRHAQTSPAERGAA